MKSSRILTVILLVAGLIAMVVGAGGLFAPIEFHASGGIVLDGGVELLNEMRAAGGTLFVGGLLIGAGAFFTRLAFTSTLFAIVVYLSYGLSRLVSVALDGMPNATLLSIAALEIAIGLICVFFALARFRDRRALRI